jgi:hypothetical protein
MATEGEEMEVAGLLKTFKPVGHGERILLPPGPQKPWQRRESTKWRVLSEDVVGLRRGKGTIASRHQPSPS